MTAGIDFALTLIAEIFGEKDAQEIQLRLEYAPAPPFDAVRPEVASSQTVQAVSGRFAGSAEETREHVKTVAERRGVLGAVAPLRTPSERGASD